MRLTTKGKVLTGLAVVVVAAAIGVGSTLTAHASPSSADHPATSQVPTASPTPSPATPVPPPASLAHAAQGTWTTTDAAGTRTVHDMARGTVKIITPVVLVVRTATGTTVPFALPLTSDDIVEMHGTTATTVPYTSLSVGEAVTATGTIPTATDDSTLTAVWPAANGS